METPKLILTSESVNKIPWCDHSNETSLAVLSHGTIHNLGFYKSEIWDWSWILILGTLGSERVKPHYQHTCSPHCSPYVSYVTSWENLLTHQDTSSLVIISLILVTCMFDQVMIL